MEASGNEGSGGRRVIEHPSSDDFSDDNVIQGYDPIDVV